METYLKYSTYEKRCYICNNKTNSYISFEDNKFNLNIFIHCDCIKKINTQKVKDFFKDMNSYIIRKTK